MTINDFIEYVLDRELVELFSFEKEDIVWSGWSDDIPDEYLEMSIHSWNCIPNGICFNID